MSETPNNDPLVLRSDKDKVATLTLNRPEKYNTLSTPMLKALRAVLEDVATDRSIRAVVLTGAGKAFCVGHDLREMQADPGENAMRDLFELCGEVMIGISKLPQPVIAKVQGVAAAAGCQLVAQCDLAIAAEDAKFGTSGINVGLYCSTPAVPVTRNLSRKHAMELLITGDMIPARQAAEWGLINRAVPAAELDAAVDELAGKIASKSPGAVALGKSLFYTQIEDGMQSAYARAAKAITRNMQSEETRAAIDAFIAKKPMPNWSDR